MSFSQYADKQDFIVLRGSKIAMGIIDLGADTELSNILLTFFKTGSLVGSEQLRINLYSSDRYESSFAQSDWVSVSDITNLATNWLGWLRFDFSRIDIDKDNLIYAEIETQNYTRVGDTFWMGIGLDWPVLVNTFDSNDGAPAALQIFGYK